MIAIIVFNNPGAISCSLSQIDKYYDGYSFSQVSKQLLIIMIPTCHWFDTSNSSNNIGFSLKSAANYFILNIWNAVLQGLCTGHGSQIRDKSCLWRISKVYRILPAAFHIFQDSSSFSCSIPHLNLSEQCSNLNKLHAFD